MSAERTCAQCKHWDRDGGGSSHYRDDGSPPVELSQRRCLKVVVWDGGSPPSVSQAYLSACDACHLTLRTPEDFFCASFEPRVGP